MLAAMALTACGTVPLPGPPDEPPLFHRIDARVGVAYSTAARTATINNPLLRIEVGKASVARFEQVFSAMFTKAVELPDWPPWREAAPDVDGVIELEHIKADVVLGDDWRRPDAVRVAFRLCLRLPDGTEIQCWTSSAQQHHQRIVFECLDIRACVVPHVEITLREALARFMVEADQDPTLKAWAARVAQRGRRP